VKNLKPGSQNDRILTYMRQRPSKGITALEALSSFGAFRLAGRIYDIKGHLAHANTGETIETVEKTDPRGRTYARYYLRPASYVSRPNVQPQPARDPRYVQQRHEAPAYL
jgi:hypothetical protein